MSRARGLTTAKCTNRIQARVPLFQDQQPFPRVTGLETVRGRSNLSRPQHSLHGRPAPLPLSGEESTAAVPQTHTGDQSAGGRPV